MLKISLLSTGDGGVLKSILHKGDGYSMPTEGAVVEGTKHRWLVRSC